MAGPEDKLPTQEQIAKRAFEIYVQRGRENGTERDNWQAAEQELLQHSSEPEQHRVLNYSGEQANLEPTSMLLDFFGLREQPFGMTPDPAYLYASDTHRDALSALKFGVAENRGFFALVAQPGMGKTTLLYRLLEDLDDGARTVLVSQTQCNSRELIAYILHELGVESEGMGLVTMHGKLNEILFNELMAGKRFVLVVDEAQNLDDAVLETVRMLSNFETHNTKLVQIILSGQPRLAAKLAQPKLIQLRQRLAVVSHLEPFTAEETASYIAHRLSVAGHSGAPIFDSGAIAEIARESDGIPRNINNICFNAMLAAFHRGQRQVTAESVRKAVANLDLEALISKPAKPAVPAVPAPVLPAAMTEDVQVSGPQKSAVDEAAPAFAPVPEKMVTPEPAPLQPPAAQEVAAPEAVAPSIVSAPQQVWAPEPTSILEFAPRPLDATELSSALAPAAPQKSPLAEAAPEPVPTPQKIWEPAPDPVPASAAASAANSDVPVNPAAAVLAAVTSRISQPNPAPGFVSPADPVSAPASPFKPIPKSAQTPVTVPAKKGRAATEFVSYEDYKKRSLKRWQIRSVIVTAILLTAILALAILGRSQSKRGITPHLFDSSSGSIGPFVPSSSSYDAAPMDTNDGVILTVAASENQSIRDLGLRYLGHFDSNLSRQILALNPDLKDPDHLQAGQLIRIPLPTGALKKMNDTGDAGSAASNPSDTSSVLGRIDALLRGQK